MSDLDTLTSVLEKLHYRIDDKLEQHELHLLQLDRERKLMAAQLEELQQKLGELQSQLVEQEGLVRQAVALRKEFEFFKVQQLPVVTPDVGMKYLTRDGNIAIISAFTRESHEDDGTYKGAVVGKGSSSWRPDGTNTEKEQWNLKARKI